MLLQCETGATKNNDENLLQSSRRDEENGENGRSKERGKENGENGENGRSKERE